MFTIFQRPRHLHASLSITFATPSIAERKPFVFFRLHHLASWPF